jgi:hypothetical protein
MKQILLLRLLIITGACNSTAVMGQVTKGGADQAAEKKASTLVPIILEEYKAIRGEIILCLGERVTIVSFGFAAIGALLAVGVSAATRDRPLWVLAAMIFCVGVSLTSLYVLDVWNVESQRLARASYHNYSLELKLQRLLPGDVTPLEWEGRLRPGNSDKNYEKLQPSEKGTPWVFLIISVLSTLCGFGLFLRGVKDRSMRYGWGIAFALIVVLPLLWGAYNRYDTLAKIDDLFKLSPPH